MKIGHYMQGIWDPGGVCSYVRRVSAEQVKQGHEVCYYDTEARSLDKDTSGLLTLVGDATDLWKRAQNDSVDIIHMHTSIECNDEWERVAESGPPAAVRTLHNHRPYCPSETQYLSAKNTQCERIYSIAGCTAGHIFDRCGSIRPQRILQNFRSTWNEQRLLRHMPTLTVSSFLRNRMIRTGYDPSTIHVLQIAVDWDNRYEPPPSVGPPRFIFVGRLTPLKGVRWLIDSVKLTKSPLFLDVVGDGPIASEMKELVARLGIAERVVFHGWQPHESVDQLIGASRAVIYPSVWHEPSGTVLLEAGVRGRAVIASEVGGIPEYITDGATGIIAKPGDTSALASAIDRLADDLPYAVKLGLAGREVVGRQNTVEYHCARLNEYYDLYLTRLRKQQMSDVAV